MAFTVDRLDQGDSWRQLSGAQHAELLASLKSALEEALEFNRADAVAAAGSNFTEEQIAL